MFRTILLATAISGLITGCIIPSSNSAPTDFPLNYLPTVIHLTAVAIDATHSVTAIPTFISTEQPTVILPSSTPTETPTAAPGVLLAAIQINAPGPMSKIVSPLELHLFAIAGASRKIEIDLFGEDGRLLGRSVKTVPGQPGGDSLSVKLPFQIRAAGENGLVQVSTKDESGRLQSLTSVHILLLSIGTTQITPAGNTIYERVTFYNLIPKASVSGGVLPLQGKFTPYDHQPVFLELVGDDGKSLGVRQLNFSGLDSQDFETTLPYKVAATTQARLFVRQKDDVIDGPGYVYSQLITLNP